MSLRVHLARLKRNLFKKPFLKDPKHPPFWFDKALGKQGAFLVQIGSNDGKTGDPFNQLLNKNTGWKALFVEPVPYLFQRLRNNYPDTARFSFANNAINDGSAITFYWLDPRVKDEFDDLPFWYDQLGSFDENHIINELGERMRPFILSQKLEGLSLPALLERHAVRQLDMLHIDTEGYDWKILSQLDLQQHQPKFVLYESNHLTKEELHASYDFLKDHYELFEAGIDVLAVHRQEMAPLLPAIRKNMQTISRP